MPTGCLGSTRSLVQRLWHNVIRLGKWGKHCERVRSERETKEKVHKLYHSKWKEFPHWNNKNLYWLSQLYCSSVQYHGCGGLHYLSFLSQSVNHFPGLLSNHKPPGSLADFLFASDPEYNPHILTQSRQKGALSSAVVVFYQLISNTWSHANPLTPLAVCAHTNRNKHTETHYINCLFSPMLIIS